VIVAACPACADRDLLDAGGELLPATALPAGATDKPPLFNLGRVAVTAGAVAALADAGLDALPFLARHAVGDFGKLGNAAEIQVSAAELRHGPLETSDDGKLNLLAARTGRGRVLSSYELAAGVVLWVLTDMAGGVSVTTVLLPDEY
jgi:hypothetical protein